MKRLLLIIVVSTLIFSTTLAQDTVGNGVIDSLFVDTFLNPMIREALERNCDLRITKENISQAEAMLKTMRLSYVPSFALAPSGALNVAQEKSAALTYALPVTMEWELSLGGRQTFERRVAEFNRLQAEDQFVYEQILLIANVCNAYYTLVMLDRQCDIVQQSINNQLAALQTIKTLREVGKMDELAVNQAKSTLYATRSSLADLELQRKQMETVVALLLNRDANDAHVVRSGWASRQGIRMDWKQPIALEQLSMRPDVRRAEHVLAAACGNVGVAKSAFYPTLRISASGGWTNDVGEIVNPMKLLLNLIASLTQPLFNRGLHRAQLRVALSQRTQAEIGFERALLTAGGEVKDALEACRTAAMKREMRENQVLSSSAAWENCRDLLRYSDRITYLDVLNAEAALLNAQLEAAADWLQEQQAYVSLYKAMCFVGP